MADSARTPERKVEQGAMMGIGKALPAVGGKMGQILLLCSTTVMSYTDLKHSAAISDAALSKDLEVLQERGFISKVPNGYVATKDGYVAAQQLRLASEVTRHKLARKLIILQKLIDPKELLGFETLRAMVEPPDTLRKYLAMAIVSSVQIAYLHTDPLSASDEVKLYEQALKAVRELLKVDRSQKHAGLIVRFDIDEGFRAVVSELEHKVTVAGDAEKKKILSEILKKMSDPKNREDLLRDALERFLIR